MAMLGMVSCKDQTADVITTNTATDSKDFAITDWTTATHSNDVDPDYATVFPQDKVNTLTITMTSANWSAIQTNMKSLFGYGFGERTQAGGGFPSQETDYVAVSLKFNDKEWYKVGFRLKGNSSLSSTWGSGIYKLPFRLNFDKFEDDYPQIKNQRFYGFKEFSLSPGYKDNSLIREKVTADIFRMAGIPAAQTAFYKVYIDFGSGSKYCGVYTLTEVVDDTMIKTQFSEDSGNVYKPESTFQTFSSSVFEKKNNETANDFSDVQAFVAALNSSLRTSNAAQWRTNLEQSFNADHFVKWLAVNTTLVNWDTYGVMAHNYYLYNHSVNKLTWIPWDNNEALANRSGPGGSAVSLSLSGVSSSWPLIRYIADDATYYAKYKTYVRVFADDVFTSAKMDALFTKYHTLISPYVIGPEATEQAKYTHLSSSSAFTTELATLKQHVVSRKQAVDAFVP
ncbi:MAG: CotH kinase family protein [Bacteroidetes bacterium]|nr:CotH kinase family protein [Bacteroidota bacterium]